ncbi:beta-1,4 N-acetylgalactosaminyltransferase 2-like isoform X1 [Anguilla anguilla]|uniref:beta-1,4 N-acetylgalactosaminyltransferase 2-like isoform X1 n=1 Tax=Anguilla anguilla TaxID=7936 RepID=UPI0015A8FDFB|nr:beta-1,4 N-acetylgalactosaminyltransferase 2-like isoform X1 [Anguilla anguilla]
MSVLLSLTKFLLIASTATILSLCYLYMETGKCTSPPLQRAYNPMPNVTRQPTSCSCPRSMIDLTKYVNKDKFSDIVKRRAEVFEQDQIRKKTILNELLLAPPHSPLQYPIQGFIVSPLKKGIIPGLSVHTVQKQSYKVTLSVSSGVLAVERLQEKDQVEGQGEKVLSISASSLYSLNDLLGRVSYRSTVYSIKSGDLVHFTFEQYKAIFPVVIRQRTVPVLYELGEDIKSQVTVTTKTFLRYPEVNYLVKTIRQFYEDIKIIIADDSLKPQKVNGDNIEQYFMPPAQGWFAGRNLAVSQVTTKYFLWVDDDFYFTERTKIERFVEIMESKPELDVVAGSVGEYANSFTLIYDEGDEDGGCLTRVKGTYQPIPEIPNCYYASGVINFFLARTDAVRRVGFDPLLKRVGHSEMFMDGLGELLVAICPEVGLNHQRRKANPQYKKFRKPAKSDTDNKLYLHFFKNRLKCMKW